MSSQTKTIDKILTAIIFSAAFLVAIYLTLGKLEKYLKIKAMHQCAQIASVSYTNDEGATVTEPYKPVYESCLKMKGY